MHHAKHQFRLMLKIFTGLCLLSGLASHNARADDAWSDHFIGGAPGGQPGSWFDNYFRYADIAYDAVDSYANIILTAEESGSVSSETKDINLDTYPHFQVVVSYMDPGTQLDIAVQSGADYELLEQVSMAGTYNYHLPSQISLNGTVPIYCNFKIWGNQSQRVQLDLVRFWDGLNDYIPTPTTTITPTPISGKIFWEDDFIRPTPGPSESGHAEIRPTSWFDSYPSAKIRYDNETISQAEVMINNYNGTGVVTSATQSIDLDKFAYLQVKVSKIEKNAKLQIALQNADTNEYHLFEEIEEIDRDTYNYCLPSATGDSGKVRYFVCLQPWGGYGQKVNIDYVRFWQPDDPKLLNITAVQPTATSTKVHDLRGQRQVLAYPNPGKGTIYFSWDTMNVQAVRVNIYNLTGERIATLQEKTVGNEVAWQAQDIAPGIYFYQIILTIQGKEQKQPFGKLAIIE